MIFLGGLLISAVGLAVASYVERKVINTPSIEHKSDKNLTDNTNLPIPIRSKYRFVLTTATMGLAVVAQFSSIIWLTPISLFLIGYFSTSIIKEAAVAIFEDRKIKVDILDGIVISLSVLFGQIAAAAFMVWVLDLADMLLEKTRRKSRQYITSIFGEQARFAWLLVDGQELQVKVKELQKDDIIIVSTGEQVPIDGIIVEGDAMIDQQSLTGEATPVDKHEKENVFASTVIVAGKIKVRILKTGEDTLASKIIKIINEASDYQVKLQHMGEKIADKAVIPTLGLGALGYITTGPGALLAIVNADYGTGIRIAAPIALLASLGIAAKNGLLIKDGKVFEMLKDIDVILFDKTGTLTTETPIVSNIIPTDDRYQEEKILFYTATAEQKFSHPIATAILQKAKDRNMILPQYDDSHYYVGLGIEVKIDGDLVKVGSSRYMEREKIKIPPSIESALQKTRERGQSGILTAINNEIAGMIEFKSKIRDEAVQVIADLKREGIKEIVLISGDHDAPTRELSRKLGIDRYFAGVLPHEKADYVRLLQDEGKKVMMVGDGINDSAALSYADIGVSLKGASTIAVDVADVIFMDGSLKKFHYLFYISNVLQKNVRRSFYLIAVPNTLCIAGAFMGIFGLRGSLILNNGFNLIAAMNGMLPYRMEELKELVDNQSVHGSIVNQELEN
ncbi:heavy metal translocating P-type ATPase [Thiotrichales bacterium HSG1]|nr:heavy metal translocating P-type ATPase [Thiotrichales bacterium HSG1]